jgi:hypothetical protein
MAYINASEASSFVTLVFSTATISSTATTGMIVVPGLQNITVNNGNGVFRWKTLDSGSEKAIATPATNQLSLNIVMDPTTFFGSTTTNQVTTAERGLFKLSNDKTPIYFRMYWNATNPGTGSKYVTASEGDNVVVDCDREHLPKYLIVNLYLLINSKEEFHHS